MSPPLLNWAALAEFEGAAVTRRRDFQARDLTKRHDDLT
jgi:hypothetical protein